MNRSGQEVNKRKSGTKCQTGDPCAFA